MALNIYGQLPVLYLNEKNKEFHQIYFPKAFNIFSNIKCSMREFLGLSEAKNLLVSMQALRNSASFELHDGVTLGAFQGKRYLMKVNPESLIEFEVYLKGLREEPVLEVISNYLDCEAEYAYLDIGANVGTTTLPISKKYPNVECIAVEPHPTLCKRLRENIALNKLNNVTVIESSISDVGSPEISFFSQCPQPNMGLSALKANPDLENFEKIIVSNILDKIVLSLKSKHVIIKIDTQGSEYSILRSGLNVIKKYRPVIIFEYETEYDVDSGSASQANLI